MESSKQHNRPIFDPIRKLWLDETKEEVVRQALIRELTEHRGYPKELIVVEKQLKELPHLQGQKQQLPLRRLDLLCYYRNKERLLPLLLIECKEGDLAEEHFKQLLGYNHHVKALFVALVSEKMRRFAFAAEEQVVEFPFIPSYFQLIKALHDNAFFIG